MNTVKKKKHPCNPCLSRVTENSFFGDSSRIVLGKQQQAHFQPVFLKLFLKQKNSKNKLFCCCFFRKFFKGKKSQKKGLKCQCGIFKIIFLKRLQEKKIIPPGENR